MRALLKDAILLSAFLSIASAQSAEQVLRPGDRVAVMLAGTGSAVWRLNVPGGHTVQLSIHEIGGVAGILSVEDSSGAPMVHIDCTIRTPAAKSVTLVGGGYRVFVRPSYHAPVARKFEIEIGNPIEPSLADHDRVAAEQLVGEGERIYRTAAPDHIAAAREKYEAALAIYKRLGDRARQADTLGHLANNVFELGQMKAGLDLYASELELWKSLQDQAGIAAALYGMGLVSGDLGQPQRASEYQHQSLEIRRALGDVRGQAETLDYLATSELTQGHNQQGLEFAETGLKMSREAGERVREIDAELILGLGFYRTGESSAAIEHWNAALSLSKVEDQPARTGTALSNLGAIYNSIGDPRRALGSYEEALPYRKLQFPGSYANTLYHAGVAHAELGDYQVATDHLNQALAIFRKEKFGIGQSYTLIALADLSLELGRDAQAREDLNESLAIARRGSDKRDIMDALLKLGRMDSRAGRNAKALEESQAALASAREAGYPSEQAQALSGIAEAKLHSGDARGAIDPLLEALALTRSSGMKLLESNALELEGKAFHQLGEIEAARKAFSAALDLRRSAGAASSEAETLFDLASLEHELHLPADATRDAISALDIVESMRASFGNHQSRIEAASMHRNYYDLAIQIAMDSGDSARALEISERARARGLLDMLSDARVDFRQGVDPALLDRKRETDELLDAKHERFLKLLDSPHTAAREASARKEIDELIDRDAAIEAQVRKASPASAALGEPKPILLPEIQALLPDRATVMTEFWLGEKTSFAWVVSKHGCRGFVLPPRVQIEAAAKRAYQAVSTNRTEVTSDFARLQEMLAPVLQSAAATKRWWVVGDGALEYIPFSLLDSPAVPHEIVQLASASVLAEERHRFSGRAKAPAEVAVFADPVFRADDARVTRGEAPALPADTHLDRAAAETGFGAIERLHFSRDEAQRIADLVPPAQRWIALDFDASRAAVEQPRLSRYRIVHFATHGLIDSRHPELSGLVLSMVDRQGRAQDGFLSLHDVYNLKLTADLVVLSACQTALGESVRSEGMIGLTRGFMYAGAPQVLASLWKVDDRATAEFMRLFYEALLRHAQAPAAALHSAMTAMRHEPRWNNPYYWSAFVLQGSK